MTVWKYRLSIILPETDKPALNALFTAIGPETDGEANSFGVPLSATGQEPVTHRGASGSITEEMRVLIQDIFADEFQNSVIEIWPNYINNWAEFLAENSLMAIEPEEV